MALRILYAADPIGTRWDLPHLSPEPVEELLRRQHGAMARWQAYVVRMSEQILRRQVANGRLRQPYPSAYVLRGGERPPYTEMMAAVAACGPGARLSGSAAAWLWRLPHGCPDAVEIAVPRGRRVRVPGLRITQIDGLPVVDDESDEEWGVPVLDPLWAILVNAARLGRLKPVQDMVDDGYRRRLFSLEQLHDFVAEQAPRRPGAALLRAAAADAVPYSESGAEALAIRIIRRSGLPEPVGPILLRDGPRILRVDYGYPDIPLMLEIDGFRYHLLKRDTDRDARKEELMDLAGVEWMRVTLAELTQQPEVFIARLGRRLAAGSTGRGPAP
jgi:hypothetical protein